MREIGYGYQSDVLRTILGVENQAPFDVEDALRGAIVLESERPEWGFLRNEFLFISRQLNVAAVAGQLSWLAITNRTPSSLVVVTAFQNNSSQTVNFVRGRFPDAAFEAAVNTEVPAIPIDIRVPGTPDASLAARECTGDTLIGSTPYGAAAPAITYPTDPRMPCLSILGPGSYVAALGSVVNTIVAGVFYGYTKQLFRADRA